MLRAVSGETKVNDTRGRTCRPPAFAPGVFPHSDLGGMAKYIFYSDRLSETMNAITLISLTFFHSDMRSLPCKIGLVGVKLVQGGSAHPGGQARNK
jgi:hypothetical protein